MAYNHFFFFSSRRRHTISLCDWSSDVCSSELVDHLPASATVPTPLKFLGRIVGTPGELTYAKDIHRYFDELARTSPRVKVWRMGKSEEGRDMIGAVIADEGALKNPDQYKAPLNQLTDPRRTTEEQAPAIIK